MNTSCLMMDHMTQMTHDANKIGIVRAMCDRQMKIHRRVGGRLPIRSVLFQAFERNIKRLKLSRRTVGRSERSRSRLDLDAQLMHMDQL